MKKIIYLIFLTTTLISAQRIRQLSYQSIKLGVENPIANFDADYQAVLNEAISIKAILPSIVNQRFQNDIVLELKAKGLWDSHDGIFYFLDNSDWLFKSINWKNPTGEKAKDVGSGELITDSTGIQGDGNNYLDTSVSLSSYTLNDASFSFDVVDAAGALVQARNGSSTNTRVLASNTFQYLNSSSGGITDVSAIGFYSYSRNASNSVKLSKDGVVVDTKTYSSTSLPTENFYLFTNGSIRGLGKIGFFAVGSSVDGNENAMYNAITNAPNVTLSGGIYSGGYTPLIFSGNYGTFDTPSLTYTIDKNSAGITNGIVTDLIAKNNRKILAEAIRHAVEVEGATTIVFDSTMDAYFNVETSISGRENAYAKSIQIGYDNLTIDMSTATLRVQPNQYFAHTLLGAWAVTNFTVKNGFIIGDRYTHNYNPETSLTHDNGMGLVVYGGKNVLVDNLHASKFIGDGLGIRSTASRNNDGTEVGGEFYTEGFTVQNCTFTDNRRNGMAITDGSNILIDNCDFSYIGLSPLAGQTWGLSSNGYIPRYGIDLEAIQSFDGSGDLNKTELIDGVRITNCDYSNNYGDIDIYKCQNVEIDNNNFGSNLSNVNSWDINIHDNAFIKNSPEGENEAITVASNYNDVTGVNQTLGWQIVDNTINGYHTGFRIGGDGMVVTGNTITNYTKYGLYLSTGENLTVNNNSFSTSQLSTIAVYGYPLGFTVDNFNITNSQFTGAVFGMDLIDITASTANDLIFDNCAFTGTMKINDVSNMTIQNSTFQTPFQESGTNNVVLTNNNP